MATNCIRGLRIHVQILCIKTNVANVHYIDAQHVRHGIKNDCYVDVRVHVLRRLC